MKCAAALALLAGSAAAFVPSQQSARVSTVVNGGMDDLKTIAAKANPLLKVRLVGLWLTEDCSLEIVNTKRCLYLALAKESAHI